MLAQLMAVWDSPERKKRFSQEESMVLEQIGESKLLIKCFVVYCRHHASTGDMGEKQVEHTLHTPPYPASSLTPTHPNPHPPLYGTSVLPTRGSCSSDAYTAPPSFLPGATALQMLIRHPLPDRCNCSS